MATTAAAAASQAVHAHRFVKGVHGIRYRVKDVARSVAFYTQHLGFQMRHQQPPAAVAFVLAGCSADSPLQAPSHLAHQNGVVRSSLSETGSAHKSLKALTF